MPITQVSPPFAGDDAIVIVAGSCHVSAKQLVCDYQPMIHRAFEGFAGKICSGGTCAGISGVIGDLPDPAGAILKLAYLPLAHPPEDARHAAYTIRATTRGSYTPLDPVMLWSDLLASGVQPASVRLLGIGGGDIAAFEYRLALLLGARVAVLPESGKAAFEIAKDEDWRRAGGLLCLPADLECLRAFVQPSRPSVMIDPETREKMAASFHLDYQTNQRSRLIDQETSMADWDRLPETFKKSNLAVVDQIEDKLRRLGLELRRVPNPAPETYEFSDDQIEALAEMEHGRWVVERLLDGWVYGDQRDDVKKTRPQLIPWADLPESEKDKDRDGVGHIPENLAKFGYEIFEPPES